MRATRPLRIAAGLAAAPFALAACHLGVPHPSAALSASPNPLVLSTTVGGPADTGTVTITNVGEAPTSGPLVVEPVGSFVPSSDDCTGEILDPAETCELEFTYPAADGLEARESSVLVRVQGDVVLVNVRVEGSTTAAA